MKRTLLRLGAAAFLADMALYLIMTGVPYRALEMGAGAALLGLLPVARGLPYTLTVVWAGGRSKPGRRMRSACFTVAAGVLATVAFIAAPSLPWIFVLLGVLGLAFAFYWPALQATLADLGRAGAAGNLGWFNMAWCSGKALGFAMGGVLLAAFGFPALFSMAAVAMVAVIGLIALPVRLFPEATRRADESGRATAAALRPGNARAFRLAAWTANAVAYGVATLLNIHYPHWLREIGHGETLLGAYLGLIFAAQALTFFLLTRFPGWRYRRAPLLLLQAPMVLVLLVLPLLRSPAAILATAPGVGLALGMAYFASLYYSVEAPAGRGRNAGLHEAILGIGSMLVPVLGGWVAGATGRIEAPYLVGAAIGGIGLGVQAMLLRSRAGG